MTVLLTFRSLSNVTLCFCTLAKATTLVSAPIIRTITTRFRIDFIALSLLFVQLALEGTLCRLAKASLIPKTLQVDSYHCYCDSPKRQKVGLPEFLFDLR